MENMNKCRYVRPSQEELALAALNGADVVSVSPIIESVEIDEQDEDHNEFIPDLVSFQDDVIEEAIKLICKKYQLVV